MDQTKTISQCNRGEDLVSFLYGEISDREATEFQTHLQQCSACQSELVEFGDVHQSMVSWRDEMLAGFVATPVSAPVRQKSALAALREFFDLSPLWLKGAVGFAALLLVALAFMSLSQTKSQQAPLPLVSEAKYTDQQLQERIAQAQKEWIASQTPKKDPKEEIQTAPKPRQNVVINRVLPKRDRSPLSKSEREQLAADLRLRSTDDDALTLLGERINQDF
jgi:anti-sigma factor RsiW